MLNFVEKNYYTTALKYYTFRKLKSDCTEKFKFTSASHQTTPLSRQYQMSDHGAKISDHRATDVSQHSARAPQ